MLQLNQQKCWGQHELNLGLKAATLGSLTAHVEFFYNSLQDKNEHLRSSLKPDPFNEVMITD